MKKRFNRTNKDYLTSQEFITLLNDTSENINSDRSNTFVHLKEFLSHLKLHDTKNKKRLQNSDTDSSQPQTKRRKIETITSGDSKVGLVNHSSNHESSASNCAPPSHDKYQNKSAIPSASNEEVSEMLDDQEPLTVVMVGKGLNENNNCDRPSVQVFSLGKSLMPKDASKSLKRIIPESLSKIQPLSPAEVGAENSKRGNDKKRPLDKVSDGEPKTPSKYDLKEEDASAMVGSLKTEAKNIVTETVPKIESIIKVEPENGVPKEESHDSEVDLVPLPANAFSNTEGGQLDAKQEGESVEDESTGQETSEIDGRKCSKRQLKRLEGLLEVGNFYNTYMYILERF